MKHRCELRFRSHAAFTHALLSRVPLCISWAFLVFSARELDLVNSDGWYSNDFWLLDNVDNLPVTQETELLVMLLNRAVVLDCPHLDVLWFRDRAAKIFLTQGWFLHILF